MGPASGSVVLRWRLALKNIISTVPEDGAMHFLGPKDVGFSFFFIDRVTVVDVGWGGWVLPRTLNVPF